MYWQGPHEGWAEGAFAPPPHFLVPVKNNNDNVGKSISQRLVSGLTSTVFSRGFRFNLHMDQTKTECSSRVQIGLLSFGYGLVETHARSGGVYFEEIEPAQILITIDGS